MNKNKLIPELRFPEFKNEGEWETKEIGKLFKFKQGVQVPVENQYHSQKKGMIRFIRIIDITSNSEPPRYIDNPGEDHLIKIDDLFMIRYGTPGLISIGFEGVIANNLFRLIWDSDEKFKPKYWFYSFQKIEKVIYNLSGSSSMPAISFSTLDNLDIIYPRNTQEQQKIASCLSSLDEVIAAHSQKLDILKDHKKGLMQNLFPQEGEIIPKLRFPEFANDREWVENPLDKVCEINPKIPQLPEKFVYIDLESVENGTLLQKKIINIKRAPSRAQRLLKENDVIFQTVRPYQMNNYYFKKDEDFDYVASTGYAQLRSFESSMYLYQFIHTDRFVANVLEKCTGSNYPAINSSDLSQISVQIPKPQEQQKIADCLSSLDALITAQAEKIEVLKLHKRGLMQGLFPKIKE